MTVATELSYKEISSVMLDMGWDSGWGFVQLCQHEIFNEAYNEKIVT